MFPTIIHNNSRFEQVAYYFLSNDVITQTLTLSIGSYSVVYEGGKLIHP